MHTLKQQPNRRLSHFILIVLLAGQTAVFAETAENQDQGAPHAQHSKDWPGVYNGFLPCADCIGVKTSLALNANSSYILITQNVGKSPRDFVEKGKFSWTDKDNTILLKPNNGAKSRLYLVNESEITVLDDEGNIIGGQHAEKYVLHRTEGLGKSTNHGH